MQPHIDDEKTLRQIGEILATDKNVRQALSDAYHLGRIRGTLEGAGNVIDRMASAMTVV